MTFPKGFLIGASTAAHQVEGNNIHSDYWAQEQMPHSSFAEPSGLACDHYNRYEEDIRLMAQAGLNAYRFSIEWARIEPEEGQFDEQEIEHYRKVIRCCRDNGVEPIVTLMHFTSPVWLIRKGGWEAESTIGYFRRYAAYVAEKLINEANMGLQLAAISRRFELMARQARENAQKAEGTVQVGMNFQKMMENMKYAAQENAAVFGTPQPQVFVSSRTPEGDALVFRAHQAAREAIRSIRPEIQVGVTLSLHDLQALPGGESFAGKAWEEEFRHYLPFIQGDDFLATRRPGKRSGQSALRSRWASRFPFTICRPSREARPLQKKPGKRSSAIICRSFRGMISLVFRITPAPSTARKASCPARKARN